MIEWEYNELMEAVKNTYLRFLSTDQVKKHVIAKLVNEYANMGKLEDIIVDVAIGEIMIEQRIMLEGSFNAIRKNFKEFDTANAKDELSEKETEDLASTAWRE